MFDKEAIQELTKAEATWNANSCIDNAINVNRGALALPDNFGLHDIESYLPNSRRERGTMSTQALPDFAAFAKAHADVGATVFINTKSISATAVLNLGNKEAPGHADHLAAYNPPALAAYAALLQINGRALSQQDIAEFLEDWPGLWEALHDNETMTAPATIAAVRNITIEALRKAETSTAQLSATQSTFEQVKASSGANKLPTHIYFKCTPFLGFETRTYVLRLSIHTGEKAPSLKLRIVNKEQHDEELGNELAAKVRDAFGNAMPVHLGSYSAK